MKRFVERFRRQDGSWVAFTFEPDIAWYGVGVLRYFDVLFCWQRRDYWWVQPRGLRRLGMRFIVYRLDLVLGSAHVYAGEPS